MATIQQTLERAVQFHRTGKLEQAETLYRQVIRLDPKHADACNLLGISCHQRRMGPEAIRYIRQAVEINQSAAPYHCSLGTAYRGNGDFDAAIASYRRALQLQPVYPEAEYNLGIVLQAQDDQTSAEDCFRRALVEMPNNVDVLLNLGNSLQAQGRFDEASDCFRKILDEHPGHFEAQFNLGNCYKEQGQYIFAGDHYRRAVELNPESAVTHFHLANMLQLQERHAEAAAAYGDSLRIDSSGAEAYNNLGATLYSLRELDESVASYRQAIEIDADYAEAHNNLGQVLFAQGKFAQALESMQRALELKPTLPDVYVNLGDLYCSARKMDHACQCFEKAVALAPDDTDSWRRLATVYRLEQRIDKAKAAFVRAAGDQVNSPLAQLWLGNFCPAILDNDEQIDQHREQLAELVSRVSQTDRRHSFEEIMHYGSMPPSNLQFHDRNNRQLLEAYADIYRGCLQSQKPAAGAGKPRIGFVVTSGHEGIFDRFMGGVVERLNRDLFEPVIVCSPTGADTLRRLRGESSTELMPVPFRHDLLIEEMRNARFDVLYHFEVGTDLTNYLLPFLQMAPVQCASQGIAQTTGISEIDYYLSSGLQEPDNADEHYTEQLIRAPGLLSCQPRRRISDAGKTPAELGLPEGRTHYACPQKLRKIQHDFDPLLREILERDTKGILVLVEDHSGRDAARLRQRIQQTMPSVADRVHFVKRLSLDDYFSLTAAADVLLDPLHYGSGETMYDAMCFNKPVVTLPGRFIRGRYALGIYRRIGVDDCIASSPSDYVDKAVQLGTDTEYRRAIEEKLAEATPELFDDHSMIDEYNRIFMKLIEEARGHCAKGSVR